MLLAGGGFFFGMDKARAFLLQRQKWKGAVCFAAGVMLIFLRYPKTGFLVEAFGFVNLFA